jgi:hypothetical protein
MEGEMSLLVNSDFEASTPDPWVRVNHASAVSWGTGVDPNPLTGTKIGVVSTTISGGSIAQDVSTGAANVAAFVFVRSSTGQSINGALAIWNLSAGVPSSTNFTVSSASEWQLVTNSILFGPGMKSIRVELYVLTINAPLLIDQFNAF